MPLLPHLRRRLMLAAARFGGWPRRLLALALFGAAALVATRPAQARPSPHPPPTVPVLVAAHDLRPGAAVGAGDLRAVRLPAAAVPHGALLPGARLTGRVLAAAARAGTPLTDISLVGPSLAATIGGQGAAAVPIRLADADAAALLRPGDRVDVLADHGAADRGPPAPADVLARDAPVMFVPKPDHESTMDGALIVVAVGEDTARRLAGAATSAHLAVTLRADR